MQPVDVVRRYYEALNRHDLALLGELLAPDVVHHGLSQDRGFAELTRMLAVYRAGFPDLVHQIDDLIEHGERVAVRIRTTGTHRGLFLGHPPSGATFAAAGMGFYTTKGDRIIAIWETFDTIGMLQQLGLYVPALNAKQIPPVRSARPAAPIAVVSVTLAEVRADPLGFLSHLLKAYGDIVSYECEGQSTILLNDAKAVRHVLHDRADIYTKESTPDLLLLKPMLGDGLLTTDGPLWQRDRKWLQPAFTRRLMMANAGRMLEVIDRTIARWLCPPQMCIDLVPEMSRLALEVAASVLFSTNVASQSQQFGEAMSVLNEAMASANPRTERAHPEFEAALGFIRRTVFQMIVARRFYDSGEDDLLAQLLRGQRERGDSDVQLIDQAVTILLAGHETTAKGLSWAIARLCEDPATLAKLIDELDALPKRPLSGSDLLALPYTEAVAKEALRLDPPVWLLTRSALVEDQIGDYPIPAGTLIAISPYLLHRHPALWDEPERFAPERFLDQRAAPHPHSYLPFGDGPRHCIGKFFGMLEMTLVLATVFRRYSVEPLWNGQPEREALVTLRPKAGLSLRLVPRTTKGRTACPVETI